jgi:hypothetical protein
MSGAVLAHPGPGLLDESVLLALVHEHVVDVGADLAGVELLDEHDPLDRFPQRKIGIDDGRRLATEFEDHRGQVLRGGRHYRPAGLARAGEHQQVEGELRELDAHAAGLFEPQQLLPREVTRRDFPQQARQRDRVLRQLDHGAIARGEGTGELREGQVDGKVPRDDQPDHSQRLRYDPVPGAGIQQGVDTPALGFHPLLQPLDGVVDAVGDRDHLGKQRFVPGAVAVVLVDGPDDGVEVFAEQPLEGQQVLPALLEIRRRIVEPGPALLAERLPQGLGDFRRRGMPRIGLTTDGGFGGLIHG